MENENLVRIEIFDPPMCCPTGICGPTIDPVLLDIQEALLRIRQIFDGQAHVERFLLSQQAARFMQNPEVLALLKKEEVVRIEIFDPPMCCPTGICGPTIDPVLLDIQESLLKIQQLFNGRTHVERFLLSQQAARFMQNPQVLALLKKEGVAVLPIIAVNGEVTKTRGYPTFQELKQWIEKGGKHDEKL